MEANNRLKKREEDIESYKKKVDNLITENKKLNLEKENAEKKNRQNKQ